MNRKPYVLFTVVSLTAALFAAVAVMFAARAAAASADADFVSTSDAYSAAERMARLCCGTVSD